ncbi:MAG TPA: hypothetical protein VKY65_19095 [Alphaproteobacteria bacterium]|nr:hypothetical protein [Alphaproteobacteria bacterium]
MSPRRSRRIAPWLAAAIALLPVACATNVTNPRVPPSGSSAAFKSGYLDGCWTGYADAGRETYQLDLRKDARRFADDPDYRAGFQRGEAACFADEKRTPSIHPDGTA